MKSIILSIALLLLFSRCDFKVETEGQSKVLTEINHEVAVDFLNAYIDNCNSSQPVGMVEWVKMTSFVTDGFIFELEKIIENANKKDPDLGIDFDPIFNAQDYPDEGVEIKNFNPESEYVILQGLEWKRFNVTVKLANINGINLVDGCGVVNIPENERPKE